MTTVRLTAAAIVLLAHAALAGPPPAPTATPAANSSQHEGFVDTVQGARERQEVDAARSMQKKTGSPDSPTAAGTGEDQKSGSPPPH
jgi:hypothetical protein